MKSNETLIISTLKEAKEKLDNQHFLEGTPEYYKKIGVVINKFELEALLNDLERLQQLEISDKNNQNLVKTNVDLVNKNLELQKENQELIVNKNVAQAVALNQKREIAELKDQIDYFKEEFEGWQSAYEWSQAQNAILKLKLQELEEVKNENKI